MQEEIRQKRRGSLLLLGSMAVIFALNAAPAAAQDQPAAGDQQAQPATESGTTETAPAEPAPEGQPAAEGQASVGVGDTAQPAEATAAASTPEPAAAAEEEKTDVEEIVVTGSRIGRNNLDEYAHIAVVSSEDITLTSTTSMDELLTKMPSVTLQGLSKQQNNGGEGLAFVDLRNLGSGRTLVLINNRRFVPAGSGGSVDINNIPTAMIERVEVLLDGASAVYGSDAIGGVINFILKQDFEGVNIEASGGISGKGDYGTATVSATMGGNYDKGNAVVNFTYYHQEPLWQKDRDWSKQPYEEYYDMDEEGNVLDTTYKVFGSGSVPWGHAIDPYTYQQWSFKENPDTGLNFSPWVNSGQTLEETDRYNFGEISYLIGEMDRFSLTALANYELSEWAKAYMEGSFTHRESLTQMAPQPIGLGSNAWPGQLKVPLNNPNIPDGFIDALSPEAKQAGYFLMLKRYGELGPRQWEAITNTFTVTTGLKGNIVNQNYTWDVYGSYGNTSYETTMYNSTNLTRIEQSLDPATCEKYSNLGCVPFNLFGDYSKGDVLSAEQKAHLKFVGAQEKSGTQWNLTDLGVTLGAKLFELPGGTVSAALGGEARWEAGAFYPSYLAQSGDSGGNLSDATSGGYNAQEVFAEVSLPFVKELPAVHALTLDAAGRFSSYDTFGSAFTYRLGLAWSPIADVKLRGIYSTSFRAPSVGDLYSGTVDSFPSVTDPCTRWGTLDTSIQKYANVAANCAAQGVPENYAPLGASQIRFARMANPDLDSETARIITAGLVFSPTFIPKDLQASLTADYYNIKLTDGITTLEDQYVLDSCYESAPGPNGPTGKHCQYILGRTEVGDITGVESKPTNLGEIRTSGMDFTASFGFPVWIFRTLVGWNANYLIEYYQRNTDPDAPPPEPDENDCLEDPNQYEGTMATQSGTYTRWRNNLQLAFSGSSWKWLNQWRIIGKADVRGYKCAVDVVHKTVPTVMYWDTSASYAFKGLTLVLGMQNVLDKDPPFVMENGVNTNLQTYDFVGRYFFGKIGYQF